VLKEQSNNFCMPHDVLACDDVLIRFVLRHMAPLIWRQET